VAVAPQTWAPLDSLDGGETIFDDTLTCLIAADPATISGEQDVSDEAMAKVFDAWEVAQTHIYDRWTFLTDRANLEPKIEKALRDAYQLVSEDGGFLGHADQDLLMAKLNGRWSNSVVKAVREIIRNDDLSAEKKVRTLAEFVTEVGLSVPEQPQPLKPVRKENIRVVCWMAVAPAEERRVTSIAEQLGELPFGGQR
jgi:hypothetical protein